MKTLTLCFAGMFFYMQPVFTQIPAISWEKQIPVSASHYFSDVQELSGGNLILLGAIEQPGDRSFDIWLLELNSKGDTLKTNIFENLGNDIPMRIIPDGNNGYLLAYLNETAAKVYKSQLMALDSDFTKLWSIEAEKQPVIIRSDIAADNTGNILWMNTVMGQNKQPEVAVYTVDMKGNVINDRAFSGGHSTEGYAIRALPDGTFAMSFSILSPKEKSYVQVVRIDNAGEVLWKAKIADANKNLSPQCLCCSPDNELLAGGWAGMCYNPDAPAGEQIWDYDYLLSKIDRAGNVLWTQNYNREGSEKGTAVAVLPDGNILAAGKCETSFSGSVGPWLLLVDKNGNRINDQVYKLKFLKDQVARIISTKDGGILMVGPGYIESENQLSGWLRKLNPVL